MELQARGAGAGPRDVTIRLAVAGEGGVVYADDFHVSCVVG